ncbi:MAG: hypothetical protein [Hatfieldvirus porci]|uniref:C2H2-type domain-containing protein n=1 Tax=phage Lak_Megaphage_RVC_JS4_GC31 TaxID=3109228 RepID=A0ABZ0Z4N5_9CAUD|nr:MAG: hypothetical protein [phage Lak_Megaphage_RVC_AP3_GC31]WQJ53044.1 MAG: hypothetical protein [phage Lak_Megaphage_RVC_JS4_GC31]
MSEEKIYTCKHCGQKFTNRYKLTGHSTHCDKNPNKLTVNNLEVYNKNHKQKNRENNSYYIYYCKYCNKQYFSRNALIQHEIRCIKNENKIQNSFQKHNEKIKDGITHVWNKGLNINTSDSIKQQSNTVKTQYNLGIIHSYWKGKHFSDEYKQKIREGTIKYLNTLVPSFSPRYNKKSISFINNLNKTNNWQLQHAENGGEYLCNGYYLDGYDPINNIAFEYDESRHYEDVINNVLCKKDIERQNNIISTLHCSFWRYNEKLNLLYKVKT